jgi:hypothetical protein
VIANLSTTARSAGVPIGATFPSSGIGNKIDAKADQSVTVSTTAKGAISSPGSVGVALRWPCDLGASVDSSAQRSLHANGPISTGARQRCRHDRCGGVSGREEGQQGRQQAGGRQPRQREHEAEREHG